MLLGFRPVVCPLSVVSIAWILGAAPARAADAVFLPAVSLQLEAARYEPVETDLHWTGTVGGAADLVGVGPVRGYIAGAVETIIGNTRRGFDASQANYHLETGVRWRRGRLVLNPFFHHVSRHLIDREKVPAVDWNILGLGAGASLGAAGRAHVGGSVGHTTLASLVGYRWEVIGHGDVDLVRRPGLAVYSSAWARLLTVDPDPALPRGDFVDVAVEAGVRFSRGPRTLVTFAAYEHRNDVLLLSPGALDRALFGIRIRFADAD